MRYTGPRILPSACCRTWSSHIPLMSFHNIGSGMFASTAISSNACPKTSQFFGPHETGTNLCSDIQTCLINQLLTNAMLKQIAGSQLFASSQLLSTSCSTNRRSDMISCFFARLEALANGMKLQLNGRNLGGVQAYVHKQNASGKQSN